jgi:serine/threonine-protein kinase HipA
MDRIIQEVVSVVRDWRSLATELGISRAEQEIMSPAFGLVNKR